MYQGHWLGGGFMWIFWLLLVLVVVWILKASMGRNDGPSNRDRTPMEILRERYAKGEIDEETFEHMKRELEK